MVSFSYYSHIFGDSYGSGMGIVWEAYYKGVPLLGVPENPIDPTSTSTTTLIYRYYLVDNDIISKGCLTPPVDR